MLQVEELKTALSNVEDVLRQNLASMTGRSGTNAVRMYTAQTADLLKLRTHLTTEIARLTPKPVVKKTAVTKTTAKAVSK